MRTGGKAEFVDENRVDLRKQFISIIVQDGHGEVVAIVIDTATGIPTNLFIRGEQVTIAGSEQSEYRGTRCHVDGHRGHRRLAQAIIDGQGDGVVSSRQSSTPVEIILSYQPGDIALPPDLEKVRATGRCYRRTVPLGAIDIWESTTPGIPIAGARSGESE